MASKVVGVLGFLFLTSACQLPGSTSTCNAQIDWVNFIEVGATQYVAGQGASSDNLQESDLGPVYAHVKFKVSGNICDPNYQVKDGDAAFLDPGTPIYRVSGQSPSEQLAARLNGKIVAYRALSRAQAESLVVGPPFGRARFA